jgi:undecaprenyl-phosphate galactose phosphotransferase
MKNKIYSLPISDEFINIGKYLNQFDEILITINNISYDRLNKIVEQCKHFGKKIHIVSELYKIIPKKIEIDQLDGLSTFEVQVIQNYKSYRHFKRISDIILTILFIIFILIICESRGPILFKSEVVGLNSRSFIWYKFRSMYVDNDDIKHRQLIKDMVTGKKRDGKKIVDDPRITKVGKFIRKFSIDELPQLLNVLKGDMSLVGPRPVLLYEYDLLEEWQKKRFEVIPGITGLWQVRGRNEVGFNDQHVLDLYYIENRSIWLDIEIFLNTIPVILSGRSGV